MNYLNKINLLAFLLILFISITILSCNKNSNNFVRERDYVQLQDSIKILNDSVKSLNSKLTVSKDSTTVKIGPFKNFAKTFIEAVKSSKEDFLAMSENTIAVFSEFHPTLNKSENVNTNYPSIKDYIKGTTKIQIGKNTITFIDEPYERTMIKLFFKSFDNKWKYYKMETEAD